MSIRAIVCACGLAKPCERTDCQHSTAVAKAVANRDNYNTLQMIFSSARVNRAIAALKALKPNTDEWDRVMEDFCTGCGGPPACDYCRDD